ncbi:hypothetical protein Misp03_14190 [Microbispora sp. NBRC 16548]|nr:hypothetical protein Misp03_14190 [Microbispora sp. NBRC 16548]
MRRAVLAGFLAGPFGDDGQRHADREEHPGPGKPGIQVGPVDGEIGEQRPRERRRGEHGDAGQQPPGAGVEAGAAAPGVRRQRGGDQRQQHVEGGLDAQAPHLGEPAWPEAEPPGVDLVGLAEQQQLQPRLDVAEVRPGPQRHRHGHDQPVRREDAQGALDQVDAGVRGTLPEQRGTRVGPVEEQPGQREEDGDRDVAPGEQAAEEVVPQRRRRLDRDVEDEDGDGRERPHAVEGVHMAGGNLTGKHGCVTNRLRTGR